MPWDRFFASPYETVRDAVLAWSRSEITGTEAGKRLGGITQDAFAYRMRKHRIERGMSEDLVNERLWAAANPQAKASVPRSTHSVDGPLTIEQIIADAPDDDAPDQPLNLPPEASVQQVREAVNRAALLALAGNVGKLSKVLRAAGRNPKIVLSTSAALLGIYKETKPKERAADPGAGDDDIPLQEILRMLDAEKGTESPPPAPRPLLPPELPPAAPDGDLDAGD